MLPDRSKRHAGVDGETPRLQLASNWQLLLVAILMLGLLRVIFPHKALVEKLYDQEQLDELTLSYIENLHRTDPGNADLTILLGRVQREQLDIARLEQLLQPVVRSGNTRQRSEARMLLLGAYETLLSNEIPEEQLQPLRTRLEAFLHESNRDDIPPALAGAFAATAFRQNWFALGTQFLHRVAPGRTAEALDVYAQEALAQGRHALASEYYLLARRQATTQDAARRYFRQGINALMAASRFALAMRVAERDIGNLADDPETLRFMARTALAAGDPVRAARYAQWLVFRHSPAPAGGAP